jgi:hypothetical protein
MARDITEGIEPEQASAALARRFLHHALTAATGVGQAAVGVVEAGSTERRWITDERSALALLDDDTLDAAAVRLHLDWERFRALAAPLDGGIQTEPEDVGHWSVTFDLSQASSWPASSSWDPRMTLWLRRPLSIDEAPIASSSAETTLPSVRDVVELVESFGFDQVLDRFPWMLFGAEILPHRGLPIAGREPVPPVFYMYLLDGQEPAGGLDTLFLDPLLDILVRRHLGRSSARAEDLAASVVEGRSLVLRREIERGDSFVPLYTCICYAGDDRSDAERGLDAQVSLFSQFESVVAHQLFDISTDAEMLADQALDHESLITQGRLALNGLATGTDRQLVVDVQRALLLVDGRAVTRADEVRALDAHLSLFRETQLVATRAVLDERRVGGSRTLSAALTQQGWPERVAQQLTPVRSRWERAEAGYASLMEGLGRLFEDFRAREAEQIENAGFLLSFITGALAFLVSVDALVDFRFNDPPSWVVWFPRVAFAVFAFVAFAFLIVALARGTFLRRAVAGGGTGDPLVTRSQDLSARLASAESSPNSARLSAAQAKAIAFDHARLWDLIHSAPRDDRGSPRGRALDFIASAMSQGLRLSPLYRYSEPDAFSSRWLAATYHQTFRISSFFEFERALPFSDADCRRLWDALRNTQSRGAVEVLEALDAAHFGEATEFSLDDFTYRLREGSG